MNSSEAFCLTNWGISLYTSFVRRKSQGLSFVFPWYTRNLLIEKQVYLHYENNVVTILRKGDTDEKACKRIKDLFRYGLQAVVRFTGWVEQGKNWLGELQHVSKVMFTENHMNILSQLNSYVLRPQKKLATKKSK